MPGMLDLAAASGMDLGRTADISSNILTGFRMDASEMTRVANVMALAFSSSNTNVEQLGYAMKYAAPGARALGFSIEQTAAIVSKLSDAGIQGEMAGASLRGMLDHLTNPTEEANKLLAAMKVTTTDKQGNLRALPDIIKDIDAAMKKAGVGTARKAGIIQEIFGVRAGTGANAIWEAVLSGELDKLTEMYIKEQDGAVRKMAEKMNDTAKGAFVKLGSALESVGIDIGNVLLPPIKDTAEALAVIVGKASAFLQKYPTLTKTVVGLAAGFTALKIAALGTRLGWSFIRDGGSVAMDIFQHLRPSVIQNSLAMARLAGNGSALSGMFSSLRGGAGSFAKGLTADFAALKTGLGAVFTPVTIGAALLAGTIFLVWRNWEDFSKAWSEGCAVMGKAWEEGHIGDAIMAGLATPLASVMVLLKDIGTLWNDFVNSFNIFNSSEATGNAFKAVRERQAAGDYQSGDDMLGSAAPGAQYAVGGFISRPVVAQVGEDGPEYIIPVGSAYRERGKNLLGRAASAPGLSVALSGSEESREPPEEAFRFANWAEKLRSFVPAPQPQMAMAGTGGFSCSVTINAAPGMDERALADEVIRRIEDLQARRRRGAYGDDAFFG
jgi:TP901 family phage tail tape measure protein